jgi:hypothetical protein
MMSVIGLLHSQQAEMGLMVKQKNIYPTKFYHLYWVSDHIQIHIYIYI